MVFTTKTNISVLGRTCSVFKNVLFVSEGHPLIYLSLFLDTADCDSHGWIYLTSPFTLASAVSTLYWLCQIPLL